MDISFTNILAGAMFGIGAYFVLADMFRIPSLKTSKAIRNLAKQDTGSSAITIFLDNMAVKLSRVIKLNEFKRVKYERDLKAANMDVTPELFVSSAIVKAVPIFLLSFLLAVISPIFTILVMIMAVLIFIRELNSLQEKIKVRREEIEYDLPHFVSTIEKTLKYNRDILSILETYVENAGPAMRDELGITIADMKSGNYESALTRFESRINSSMVSDTVRGLISVIRGDDTDFYWSALSVKFSDIQRQALKDKAVKIPGKINKLSMALLFCFIALYMVVLIFAMSGQLGLMFSL